MVENNEKMENKEKKMNESLKSRIKFISEIFLMITVGILVIFPLAIFVSNFLL